jgi:hypothetical protein
MSSTHDWAVYYHSIGWCVVPLVPRSKKPTIKWIPHQTTRTNPESFRRWFVDERRDIGIVLGPVSGVSVLDIDSDEAWQVWEPLVKDLWCPMVKSPGGEHRRHVYFQHDPMLGNIPEGSRGWGYRSLREIAVAPPSMHRNGGRYRWIVPPLRVQ